MATATAKSRKTEQAVDLREYTSTVGTGAVVNREACLITGLKILGPESKNNRHYPESLRRSTARMYEGVPAYFDHLKPGDERSYADRFGVWSNIRALPEGTFGDLKYNPKHPMAEAVLHDIENGTNGVGCSPDHYGTGPVKGGRRIVESISLVKSVDIVANPATNRSFSESTNEGTDAMELAEQLSEQIGKVSALTTENASLKEQVTKLTTDNAALTAANAALKESVDAAAAVAKAADHKAKVATLLDEAKIPATARTKEFVGLLESASLEVATAAVKSLAESLKDVPTRSVNAAAGARMSEQGQQKSGGAMSLAEFKAV